MAAEEQTMLEAPQSVAELVEVAAATAPSSEGTPIIHVEGLKRNYGKIEAVKGVSFDVYPGEIFGFLGPNGAGKTTTISMLSTLLKPTAGKAIIAGYDVLNQRSQVRESIGLIFQDPSLDDRLTAGENLRFHATVYGLPADISRQRREEMLKMVDLYDRKDQGALFPLRNLPGWLSFLTKLDPVTYGVAPLRQAVLSTFGLPTFVLDQLGVNVTLFGQTLTAATELLIVAVLGLIFVTWAAIMFSRQD